MFYAQFNLAFQGHIIFKDKMLKFSQQNFIFFRRKKHTLTLLQQAWFFFARQKVGEKQNKSSEKEYKYNKNQLSIN